MSDAQTCPPFDADVLVRFLRRRIATDEAVARVARGRSWDLRQTEWFIGNLKGLGLDPWHIGRHNPDRVLAECEAKMLIVDGDPGDSYGQDLWAYDLRALALTYADHPGYRQEWKPNGPA